MLAMMGMLNMLPMLGERAINTTFQQCTKPSLLGEQGRIWLGMTNCSEHLAF